MTPQVINCYPDRAGKPFYPSNGTEGMMFTEEFCECCLHEKFTHTQRHGDEQCEIFSLTMFHDPRDKEYPKEWIFNELGWPVCTSWAKWDWGDDGGELNLPPPPPAPDDPNQLCLPFEVDLIMMAETQIEHHEYA